MDRPVNSTCTTKFPYQKSRFTPPPRKPLDHSASARHPIPSPSCHPGATFFSPIEWRTAGRVLGWWGEADSIVSRGLLLRVILCDESFRSFPFLPPTFQFLSLPSTCGSEYAVVLSHVRSFVHRKLPAIQRTTASTQADWCQE